MDPGSASAQWTSLGGERVPELDFAVAGAEADRHAAGPTIAFELRIESDAPVRAATLDVQVQIAARLRPYGETEQEALADLFGAPERWGETLRTLVWTRQTVTVPAFAGASAVTMPVACGYDLEVSAARYFAGLRGGTVPLELLFSGTVFYAGADGALRVARISWEKEAEHLLPLAVWRKAIDLHFPDSAWLRVRRGTFDRLNAARARRGDADFEDTLTALLEGSA